MIVAFQGTDGSFSHIAAQRHFAGDPHLVLTGRDTFRDVVQALSGGEADRAFLPIENTTAGAIAEVYDLVTRHDLHLVGEEVLRVVHCLSGLPGATLAGIRRVLSQPQALAQCGEFLATLPGARAEAFTDTALACGKVRADGDPTQGAIASEEAARLHGLEVLARDVADQRENFTRFVIAARAAGPCDLAVRCKTSLVLSTAHRPGALAACLEVFARAQLNLTKIQSRPMPGTPWEYLFYLDFEGNVADPRVAGALAALGRATSLLRVLGSYPAARTP